MQAAHQPTDRTRAQVEALAAYLTHAQISRHIGVSEKTLRKHYSAELSIGMLEANIKVAENLLGYASGARGTEKAQVTAAIFWAKTRMGWRETVAVVDDTDSGSGARERLASKLGLTGTAGSGEESAGIADPVGRA